MDEDELAEFRAALEGVLSDNQLVAAVQQVHSEASAGRVEGRPVGARKSQRSETDLRKDEVRIVELTEREILARLLDLTEVAIAGALAVEDAVGDLGLSLAEGSELVSPVITFSDPEPPEGSSQPPQPPSDGAGAEESRRVAAAQVVGIINEIRAQAGVQRGQWLNSVPEQQIAAHSKWVGQ